MRVLTYNVHSCRGTDRRLDLERIGKVIASTEAEVVCLQELDVGRSRTGRVHQAEALARLLMMEFHFGPAIRLATEEYGDAILSRYPLKMVRVGALPRLPGTLEPRGALWVEVVQPGGRWQIINTHFGLGRAERRAQGLAIAEWIQAARKNGPVVFCGDLNSRSGSKVHRLLGDGLVEVQSATRGKQHHTFATWGRWICLDYIYVSPEVEVLSSEVVMHPLAKVASDHFPLGAELGLKHQAPD